jgi:FkbM family methyltransferase
MLSNSVSSSNFKNIKYHNRNIPISGRHGDPYYENINIGDGTHDALMHVIDTRLCSDAVVLDIGANIGITSVMFADSHPDRTIYAYEPGPDTFPHLISTLKINGLQNCHPLQIAIGASAGEMDFLENHTSGSASHLSRNGETLGGSNRIVKVDTIDNQVETLGLSRLDLIKIDVEGFEMEVLSGGGKALVRFRPMVFLEFNSFTLMAFGDKNPRRFLEHLFNIFGHVFRFTDGGMLEMTSATDRLAFIHDNLVKHGCVDDLLCIF